jgi:hypothetical protein
MLVLGLRANSTLLDASAPVEPKPLARYDWNLMDYADHSWIGFEVAGSAENFALVRLLTSNEPFDTLHLVQIDPKTATPGDDIKVPWSNKGFSLRRRSVDGTSATVEEVRIDW